MKRFLGWAGLGVGAMLLLSSCTPLALAFAPESGPSIGLNVAPPTPMIGQLVTLGFYSARYVPDTLCEVFLLGAEEPGSEPSASIRPESGIKLGEVALQDHQGRLELELKSEYGPDPAGNVIRLEPGKTLRLRYVGTYSGRKFAGTKMIWIQPPQ